jgi:hypothetical protein
MELKTNIISKDGQTLLGRSFHVLNYFTRKTFQTNIIITLIQYIAGIITEEVIILFNATKIVVMPKNPDHHSGPIATCSLQNSTILALISMNVNKQLTLAQIEVFLRDIRAFWGSGTACKDLYDHVRDFTMKKLTTFERKKDNAGNFIFAYSRKDEKGDVEPPAPIAFRNIPIFNLHNVELPEIQFEVVLDFVQKDEEANVFYTLRSPFFDELIAFAQKEAIEGFLAEVKWPYFWGEGSIVIDDDSDKYLDNGLKA